MIVNNSDGDRKLTGQEENQQQIGRYYLRSRRPFGDVNYDSNRRGAGYHHQPNHHYQPNHLNHQNHHNTSSSNSPTVYSHPYSRQTRSQNPAQNPKNSYMYARGDEQNIPPPVSSAQKPRNSQYYRKLNSNSRDVEQPKPDFNEVIPSLLLAKGIDVTKGLKIGSGRYSKVVTAKLVNSNITVAIKIIDKSLVADDFRTKFLPREISIWQRINHANLVGLLAVYQYDSRVLLVNEYGRLGNLLSHVLDNGAVNEPLALKWAGQMISAIHYLHSKSIAHRDIKLENIVIFDENTVKLADFGFARDVGENDLSKTFCGSKAYSAPEVLSGTPYSPYKSDIWSLGVVFFVMLTNLMPFSEKQSNSKIINCQKKRSYFWPPNLRLTDGCKSSVDSLMTFDPERRPTIERCFYLPWIRPTFVEAGVQ